MSLLTNFDNFDPGIGQRSATFRFELVDAVTGYRETVNPLRDSVPVLSHDTGRTIKRQITGLKFGRVDTANINVISARLEVFMTLAGVDYPLGRYLFNDQVRQRYTSGVISNAAFYDEMIIVDQPIEVGFAETNEAIATAVSTLLTGLPITSIIDPSPYTTVGSWAPGTNRGYVLDALAIDGDYFPAWLDNDSVLRMIRTFDPAVAVVDFDFDTSNMVIQGSPLESDDVLSAPNRWVVIGNGAATSAAALTPIVGTYDVPSSAPWSIANRGFVVSRVVSRQIASQDQATAIAAALGQRQNVFERIQIATVPDPRHDSYNVIRWQGENWLELAWSLPLIEGSSMSHTARKTYTP